MRKLFVPILVLSFALISFGQAKQDGKVEELAQARLRKLVVLADLESQLAAVPYAAVRVDARYRIAAWLWKDGKDDTGRAEDVAKTAIEDYYKNRGEIPTLHAYHLRLFALLDANAKDLSKQLRAKYKPVENELVPTLMGETGSDKAQVDAAVRVLSVAGADPMQLVGLLIRLDQQASPELNRLLGSILAAEAAGRIQFTPTTLSILAGYYVKPAVAVDIWNQFARLVVNRARNVASMSVTDQDAYRRMFQKMMPVIASTFPEIQAEFGTVNAVLTATEPRSTREVRERRDRINNSSDKLAAAVAEAEKVTSETDRFSLYRYAADLALGEKQFFYAVDLMQKGGEVYAAGKSRESDKEFHRELQDDFLFDVVTRALRDRELGALAYAIDKMSGDLAKAYGFREMSKCHFEEGDAAAGTSAHDEAVKLVAKSDPSVQNIGTLMSLLPTAQKTDKARVSELNLLIAKKINALPSLSVEDKPGTKNYLDYVTNTMRLYGNLRPALVELIKTDKPAAADLVSRIEKKEIRLIADIVLLAEQTESSTAGVEFR